MTTPLADIRAALAAATLGPWIAERAFVGLPKETSAVLGPEGVDWPLVCEAEEEANAALIAAAPAWLAELIERVERAEADSKAFREYLGANPTSFVARAIAAEARVKELEGDTSIVPAHQLESALARAEAAEAEVARLKRDNDYVNRMATAQATEIEAARAEAARMREALVACLAFVEPNHTARFDALAEQFYSATGVMAPGKSVAMEMANSQPDHDERLHRYRLWLDARMAEVHGKARLALGKSGGGSSVSAVALPTGEVRTVAVITNPYAPHCHPAPEGPSRCICGAIGYDQEHGQSGGG